MTLVLAGAIEITTEELLLILAVLALFVLVVIAVGAIPVGVAVWYRTRRVWFGIGAGLPAGVLTAFGALFFAEGIAEDAWILAYVLNWGASAAFIAATRKRRQVDAIAQGTDEGSSPP